MSAAPIECLVCHCTPDNPCTFRDGEECLLNQETRICSRVACQIAAAQRAKQAVRQVQRTKAELVKPIRERIFAAQRAQRAQQQKRRSRLKRRAA